MFNENPPNIFLTSPGPGLGTSVYLVLQTGIIRAKTNANELHVRPGKNIYFIRDADTGFFDAPIQVTYSAAAGFVIYKSTSGFGLGVKLVPDAIYNTPIDMYLDNTGNLAGGGGVHIGHTITNMFNGTSATIGAISLALVISRIAAHVNDIQEGNFSLGNDMAIDI